MTQRYLLSIDQGTTGSTALFLDVTNTNAPVVAAKATVDFQQHFPAPGWVEHDLNQIWDSVCRAITSASAQLGGPSSLKHVLAIGISNQRETICVFDRITSEPLCKAVVWQCRRSTDICADVKQRGLEPMIRDKTGLVLDPYFSGSKISWLMAKNPAVNAAVRSGKAVFGTIDSWLTHKLTGGAVFATESSNASRTMLYNLNTNSWDQDLLSLFQVPSQSCLPEIRTSAGNFGVTKNVPALPDGIPISGILGDQQAALAGQGCIQVGEAKCTFGTGAFLLINCGKKAPKQGRGALTTVAWNLSGQLTYALEGSSFIAGAAVQFIRDQFSFLETSKDSESMAQKGQAAPDLYFVPALAGLSAPWWEPKARGAFLGMHRGTTKNDIIRASLEGIALQVADLTQSMTELLREDLKVLRVDGGAAANNFLMQFQSDLLRVKVDRPRDIESTAIGAALFAGLGQNLYSNVEALSSVRTSERVFLPTEDQSEQRRIAAIKSGWLKAIEAVKIFASK
jgi:glycerol kinase